MGTTGARVILNLFLPIGYLLYWACVARFWYLGGYRGASVRSRQKLPLCPTEPMPASSKTDPLLAKAECISDSGSASGRTDLRGEKSCCATETGARERSEKM